MELQIRVDRGTCIGSGQCVHFAPGVFEQDDDAISVVVDPRGEPEEKVVMAVERCPTQAISVAVDGVPVPSELLRGWSRSSLSDGPVVGLLVELGEEHHDLRQALAALGGTADGDAATGDPMPVVIRLLAAHLLREGNEAFPAIAELVGRPLVEAFARGHARIDEQTRAVGDPSATPADVAAACSELVQLVDDQLRLEEAVLFPAALGTVAARASA